MPEDREVLREREYPLIGCDAYDALPDDTSHPSDDKDPLPALAPPDGLTVPTEEPAALGAAQNQGLS
jgi:hypothetical protein